MKLFTVLVLAFFLLCPQLAFTQQSGKITGKIINPEKKPAEGAIVVLQKSSTGKILKSIIVESDGSFEFANIKPDTFNISITNAGYLNYTGTAIVINENNLAVILPLIELKLGKATELSEVIVAAKIPFVERKIDRTVVNPDALIGNTGTTALDVLEKSPGVLVDVNGNISLKGKQGVLIYIDDKPTYLASADLANYLKSLPSSSIGTIEIMTTPPAKYDAAGNAGIINIKLKRVNTIGLNAGINLSYGQGIYSKSNNSANLSYRFNKVIFFSNVSYNLGNYFQDLYINRTYFKATGGLSSLFNQNTFIKIRSEGGNAKLGFDYYINKKSTFGFVVTGFSNETNNNTINNSEISDENSVLQNKVTAISPMQRKFKNGSANLNYSLKLNEKGKELSFNADYLSYNSKINQSLLSNTYTSGGIYLSKNNLISNLPANIKITTAKVDFTTPLKSEGKFEAGAKKSFIRTINIANFFNEATGALTPNYTFSNSFNYEENINAAYLNYSFSKKRLSIQTGLRFENTNIMGYRYGNPTQSDSTFKRMYNNLFPTFYVMYNLDSTGKNILSFSYGRRIDRPNYQSMNPFTYPLDRFTLYSGNPFLQPTFSNNFEIAHTWKNAITTTLHYTYVKNVISETIEQRSNIFYSRPGNIGSQYSYGISVNGSKQIKKWWTLQLYTEAMHNSFKSVLYGQNLDNNGTYWYFGPTNQFVIDKTWTAELAGTYQTSVASGQFVIVPVWSVRAGASKKIMKGKGTVKMNISDIFYSNLPGGDIKAIANSTANWNSYLDTRVFTISLGYRFSKGKGLAARNTGSSDAEKSRVK
jgi:iron complex outermembrane recepter protein